MDSRDNDKLHLASRNVSEWKLVDALAVNVYDVMSHAHGRAVRRTRCRGSWRRWSN